MLPRSRRWHGGKVSNISTLPGPFNSGIWANMLGEWTRAGRWAFAAICVCRLIRPPLCSGSYLVYDETSTNSPDSSPRIFSMVTRLPVLLYSTVVM